MKNKKVKEIFYDDVPSVDNIKDLVKHGVGKGQDKQLFIFHKDGVEHTKTFNDVWHDINCLGTYFYSIGLKDCHIALIGENSYDWIAAYFATILGKNVFVPLDPKLPPDELSEQVVFGDCKALIYSEMYSPAADEIKNAPGMTVERFICMSEFDDIIKEGEKLLESGDSSFTDVKVGPNDLACIVFTSGTTGKSKGVMLSHGNLAADVVASCQVLHGKNSVGFLPLNHTYSWVSTIFSAFICIEYGYICSSFKNLLHDFQTYHPQNFSGVPLVVETIYKKVWKSAKKQGLDKGLKAAVVISRLLMKFGIDKRRTIFKKIHDQLGGCLELIVCGGAAIDIEYEKGLYDLGIQVLNGYGITECSPAVTANRMNNFKFGSVGLPLPCNEIKIVDPDDDGVGEIYVKGSNVMVGYYKDPEETAKVFDGDWFKTGDYGRIDKDGFLFFVGRKKNLIVTKNGKNVSPEELEDKLMQRYHYIKEVIVSQSRNKIVAEFFLDTEEYPECEDNLAHDVAEFNDNMPSWKRITSFSIRDSEFPKTTTMKIRRKYKR
ncbi:MAG: AMP-binding protein [Clostridiales bacterium]|nr:AMP-binding protein [Clostridiales bacterium]